MILIMMIFFFIFSFVSIGLYAYQNKKNRCLEKEINAILSKYKTMESEMKALLRADIIFGQCVSKLKKQLCALDDKQTLFESRRSNDGGYQHALKLLEMGGSIEEVIRDCNLTPAEAELLANLQAYQMSV